jgi:uncharacterized protein (TIGR00369 family)
MCFLCGRENPVGLKLDFYEDLAADRVKTEFVIPDVYQSYPGVVHGGIVSAILDEVSGRAAMIRGGHETFLATLRLTVRFRRPTPCETPLTAVGWVTQSSRIGTRAAAEIRLPDGSITAECDTLLAAPSREFLDRWEDEMVYWHVDS